MWKARVLDRWLSSRSLGGSTKFAMSQNKICLTHLIVSLQFQIVCAMCSQIEPMCCLTCSAAPHSDMCSHSFQPLEQGTVETFVQQGVPIHILSDRTQASYRKNAGIAWPRRRLHIAPAFLNSFIVLALGHTWIGSSYGERQGALQKH